MWSSWWPDWEAAGPVSAAGWSVWGTAHTHTLPRGASVEFDRSEWILFFFKKQWHTYTHSCCCSYLGEKLLSVTEVQWCSLTWWPQVTGWGEESQYPGAGTKQTNLIITIMFLPYSLTLYTCFNKDHAGNSEIIWIQFSVSDSIICISKLLLESTVNDEAFCPVK